MAYQLNWFNIFQQKYVFDRCDEVTDRSIFGTGNGVGANSHKLNADQQKMRKALKRRCELMYPQYSNATPEIIKMYMWKKSCDDVSHVDNFLQVFRLRTLLFLV